MTLEELNQLPLDQLRAELTRCCGSATWVNRMISCFPFRKAEDVLDQAARQWKLCGPEDYKEAFAHHPRIGDRDSIAKKFASTAQWAAGEQSGMQQADGATIDALLAGNREYEAKFGHIFIVCATGKSATDMLALLRQRLPNDPVKELEIAAEEQDKITRLRLQKLLA